MAGGCSGVGRAGGGTDHGAQEVYSSHLGTKGHSQEGCCPVGLVVTMETVCAVLSSMVATSHVWLWSTGNVSSMTEFWILFNFNQFKFDCK